MPKIFAAKQIENEEYPPMPKTTSGFVFFK